MKDFHQKLWKGCIMKIIVDSSWTDDKKKNAILEAKLEMALSSIKDIYDFDCNSVSPYDYVHNIKRKAYNTVRQIKEEGEIQEVVVSSE